MQQRQHRTVSKPRPTAFGADLRQDDARRIDTLGRALDDVVAAVVIVAGREGRAGTSDLWRLVAATRRLCALALAMYRQGGCSS